MKQDSGQLQDHRQVKRQTGAFIYFYKERHASGDFKGLKVSESARLAGREWSALTPGEKKVINDFCSLPGHR